MKMRTDAIPKPAHPRPERRRENWLNLNGEWGFSFVDRTFDRKITVPFSWVSPLSGIGENVMGTAYYCRKVEFDAKGERLWLIIGACDYETEVSVNGKVVTTHLGGYTPIEADVTDLWQAGENLIEVRATDDEEEYQMRGKQGYGNTRGIWQTVYLETRPAVYLDTFTIRTHTSGDVTVDYTLGGDADGEITVGADFPGLDFVRDERLAGMRDGRLHLHTGEPRLWSPDDPYLYEGTLTVGSGSGTDVVHTYLGIREIGTGHFDGMTYLTLNGKPFFFNSALDQSFNPKGHFTLPSDEEEENEILRLKKLGLNGVRIHIKTEEPLKLYYADRDGLLIMQDIPCFTGEPTAKARALFETQMTEAIRRDINHPAIFYWVVFNETWGLRFKSVDAEGKVTRHYTPQTQEWVRRCYHYVKGLDPTRPVEDNSPCHYDHVETDVNTFHFYPNGYENVKSRIDEFSDKHYVGSGFNFAAGNTLGDVPLMNSECGNVWGVRGTSGDSDLSWHYKYMLNEYRLHSKIQGFVFTEFHDVINEFNGYYRIDNDAKIYGYEDYVPGMTVRDLHAPDFVALDFPPMATVAPGGKVVIPFVISSFTAENHGKDMTVVWELVGAGKSGKRRVVYNAYGATKLFDLELTMPEKDGLYILRVRLMRGDEILMRNFLVFDVPAPLSGAVDISPERLVADGFIKSGLCQGGQKFNGLGEGTAVLTLCKSELPISGDAKGLEISFEASARETYARDFFMGDFKPVDAVFAKTVNPSENPNSFAMTDGTLYSATLRVDVGGIKKKTFFLPDCPADSRGCLSWHYQPVTDLLDEAGSYGYLCRLTLGRAALDSLPDVFSISFTAAEGFSIFGRKSGRYPIAIRFRAI